MDDILFLFFQVLLHCEPMVLKFANSTVNDTKYVHYRLYSLVLIASAVFGCVERKVEREERKGLEWGDALREERGWKG